MTRPTFRTRAARACLLAAAAVALVAPSIARAQPDSLPTVLGRWDVVVTGPDGPYPSWFELSASGFSSLVGRFVGRVGSARPIGSASWTDGTLRFAVSPQWDRERDDLRLEGRLDGQRIVGTIVNPNGQSHAFTATRAPAMTRTRPPVWGAPVALFNGRDLTGWTPQGGGTNHWRAVGGRLVNGASGTNLMTTRKYRDFKLHLEFRYPKGGNSGVYLRGRHEVQIEDTPPSEYPPSTGIGGVYGFLYPNESAGAGPGVWNTYDITLVGRRVTVVLNGRTVIADQIIPGITGGALDSDEGAPGPILLQGDHTGVEFRNVRIRVGR